MNNDIRLPVGFFTHPKTIRLLRQTGAEGVLCLQRIWLWAAQNKADGDLSGFNDEDLEIVAGWTGASGVLVGALAGLRFLDGDAGGYRLHDWAEHQAYAAGESRRIERARKAAKSRWDNADSHASGHADSHAGSIAPNQTNPNQANPNRNLKAATSYDVAVGEASPTAGPVSAKEPGEKGRSGAPGESGVPGDSGVPGEPGASGEYGRTVAPGKSGVPGDSGAPGESGRSAALGGTEEPGGSGDPGASGEPGARGPALPEAAECPLCPHGRIIGLYQEVLPELARVKSWQGTREKHLQARWRERWKAGRYRTQAEGLDYWKRLFEHVHERCDWLMGRVTSREGRSFRADLGWMVKPENFAKIIEGRYDRRDA